MVVQWWWRGGSRARHQELQRELNCLRILGPRLGPSTKGGGAEDITPENFSKTYM